MAETFFDRFSKATEFRFTLISESDRGCALMAAAFLDDQLCELLKANFVDHKISAELLGQSGPLGTFSSRIKLAFALGLIGNNVRRDLDLIRRIRNDFAHDPTPMSFTDQVISGRCKQFVHNYKREDCSPRSLFTGVVMSVLSAILIRRMHTDHATSPVDLSISNTNKDEIQRLLHWLDGLNVDEALEFLNNCAAALDQLITQKISKETS